MSLHDLVWYETDKIAKSVVVSIAAAWTIYQCIKIIYNVFYHPLRHIPGPKIAAATYLLEFYYDVIKSGSYTNRIWQMHEHYGIIFRAPRTLVRSMLTYVFMPFGSHQPPRSPLQR